MKRRLPDRLYRVFPDLANSKVAEWTSKETDRYNCVAYVVGDKRRHWWPANQPNSFWPNDDRETTDAFVEYFESRGFSLCGDGDFEPGSEKIAIYVKDGSPTHVALQRSDRRGAWSSKLGLDVDIAHAIEDLEGELYGRALVFMRRQRRGRG